MRKKQLALVVIVVMLATAIWTFSDEDRRWLLLNRGSAEAYALALLAEESGGQIPDKFIDYTISATDGAVLFVSHDSDGRIYGYFPDGLGSQSTVGVDWQSLDDHWYVASPGNDKGTD